MAVVRPSPAFKPYVEFTQKLQNQKTLQCHKDTLEMLLLRHKEKEEIVNSLPSKKSKTPAAEPTHIEHSPDKNYDRNHYGFVISLVCVQSS